MQRKRPFVGAIIILLIVVAGGVLYLRTDREPAASDVSAAGWKSFCSDYGYLCMRYPGDWKLETKETKDEALSPETTVITSPSGDTEIIYRPNFGATNHVEASIMSVINVDPAESPDLRVVAVVGKYDGGGIVDAPYTLENFVTNDLKSATGEIFTSGASITSNHEPVYHVFTPRNNPKITSYLYVKYDQTNPDEVAAGHFRTYEEALAVLRSDEGRTARRILQSASYRQ